MKKNIIEFLHTLSLYDYLLFGGIVFLFLFLLIVSILLRHKQTLAISLVLLAFITLLTSPVAGYIALHALLYKHSITLTTVKDLTFTEALLIKGDLNNTSNETFKECRLYVGVSKISPIKPLNKLYVYLPFRRQTIIIKGPIKPKDSETFKLLIQPFNYTKRHNVTVLGQCR
jgi:ABC-type transport system involved in multi-copper enzyme maturation permease subunit